MNVGLHLISEFALLNGLYCRSGNIREVLIFANFARRINLRISRKFAQIGGNPNTRKDLVIFARF